MQGKKDETIFAYILPQKASFGYSLPRVDWPGFPGVNATGINSRPNQFFAFGYTRPGSIPGPKPVKSVNYTEVKTFVSPPVDEIPRGDRHNAGPGGLGGDLGRRQLRQRLRWRHLPRWSLVSSIDRSRSSPSFPCIRWRPTLQS
jgi:hypothetical protein